MAFNIFVIKGEVNGENRSGSFLFLSGIFIFDTIFCLRCVGKKKPYLCSRYGS